MEDHNIYQREHEARTAEIIKDFNGDYKRLAAYAAKLELEIPDGYNIKNRVDGMINLIDGALTD